MFYLGIQEDRKSNGMCLIIQKNVQAYNRV
jgi:hypothetical protein